MFEGHGEHIFEFEVCVHVFVEYEPVSVVGATNPGCVGLDDVAAVETPVRSEVWPPSDDAEECREHICA